ncbi:energy transducer TonB [Hymenobacter sp. ASUV-10]|uniref:Energy transducer TonB n=1 Tax=Hymenobacter aranciens TaxID=3063996 RepID=A0ABT9BJB4_9BACT|nr:energy transducer TonB [Hymenobacter sp. ASUV-10]MDO7877763.1 energy transducer TonB [Hymenobacter sp. ASUV-10]
MLRYLLLTYWLVAMLATTTQAQTAALTSEIDLGSPESAPPQTGETPTAPTVLLTADEMPTFPGGDAAMLKFLSSRLNYPEAALNHSISGKVHVTFTVDAEGHLHDPRVLKGLGYGLDEEAIRLVRLMPWWKPGKQQGRAAWVQVTMPIVFRAL